MVRIFHCLALALPLAVSAQESGGDAVVLRQLVTSYEQAVRSGDVSKSGLRKSLTDGFSAALPSGQVVRNYGELSKAENALRTMVGRGAVYSAVAVNLDPVIEVSGELAAFSGQTDNRATAQGGKNRAFTTYWTAVARKEVGQWKLARHQAVMDPANNPWNAEETSSRPGWGFVLGGTLLGGLAGLVIGLALGRLLAFARPSSTPSSARASTPAASPKPRAWQASTPPTPTTAPGPTEGSPEAAPPPEPNTPASGKKRAWEK